MKYIFILSLLNYDTIFKLYLNYNGTKTLWPVMSEGISTPITSNTVGATSQRAGTSSSEPGIGNWRILREASVMINGTIEKEVFLKKKS